jgi:hypothetical protein
MGAEHILSYKETNKQIRKEKKRKKRKKGTSE